MLTVFLLIMVIILYEYMENKSRCPVIAEKVLSEGQILLQLHRGHLHFTKRAELALW